MSRGDSSVESSRDLVPLLLTILCLGWVLAVLLHRRAELRRMGQALDRLAEARASGSHGAGLACALEGLGRGLRVEVLDQDSQGGTIAKFPRAKWVLTRPVELPLHGWLKQEPCSEEEPIEVW